ncbi:response regulator transcription factor [Bradyrhizobium guangdongense]|uniref:DNA-binding response regulator n=1 Tax=Bradyrhizobium guangdongense TaxID=1325090 RepID=A0A410V3V3_9BRAD|nr:response regulator transcription factor [Bradyrhizobium guangdongense]QAU38354.1 DNA-binding response regulator [Bradyrhizobium guangdongense]QOZ59409.1 DNA-binding response regulator [Bradyrhizobium guangdongense]GGI32888.1 DNA-binding response regulator [Bradyrhizobium guangdongense]
MRTMLFVDDHPIYREGLKRALFELVHDLDVVVASGTQEALQLVDARADIDLILADYRLADGDGISILRTVAPSHCDVGLGILCADVTSDLIARVKKLGGVACLSKNRDVTQLASAIETLFAGGMVFDEKEFTSARDGSLSIRRQEIVLLAAGGYLDKEISERLNISESTVRNHWQHIFAQLGASNRTEAVFKATRLGLI